MPAEEAVEMLAAAGLDFVLIDCEHGPADVLALRSHIALAQLHDMALLVRVGHGEGALALRALDQGAEGIVAPHIDTRDQAEALVRSVRYPPIGERGFATYSRSGRFGSVPAEEHRKRAHESTLVLAMIETPTAVDNAGPILDCSGIDGYLIGTADLQASSGPHDLPLPDAVDAVHRRGQQAHAIRAALATDTHSARAALDDGAQMIVYNLTHVMMDVFRRLHIIDHS